MATAKYPLDGHPNFDMREFVHPLIWQGVGPVKARWYISDFQRDYAFLLRNVLDSPVLLNNWHEGGDLVGRGTRPASFRPKGGGTLSMHYLRLAVDASSKIFTPRQMFEKVMENEAAFKKIGLTTIENLEYTKGWLHGDGRMFIKGIHPEKGFLIVNPK